MNFESFSAPRKMNFGILLAFSFVWGAITASDYTGPPHFVPGSSHTSLTFDFDSGKWIAGFTCSFKGDQPLNISWHYNGFRVSEDGAFVVSSSIKRFVTQSSLIINDFTGDLDVEFSCLAVNSIGYASHDLWLEATPSVSVDGDSTEMMRPGDELTAECKSFPKSQLFWQIPGVASHQDDTSIENVTNEENTISTLQLTLKDAHYGEKFRCCALSRNPTKQTDPLCSEFVLNVTQSLEVIYSSDCSQHSLFTGQNCSLSCTFRSVPLSNISVSWQFCPPTSPDSDVTCTDITWNSTVSAVTATKESVVTNLQMFDSEIQIGVYKCEASDENGVLAEHSFILDTDQASSNAIVIAQHNSSEHQTVALECTFVAYPISSAYWMLNDILSSSGSTIITEDTENHDFDINDGYHDISSLKLSISPFAKEDVKRYSCVVNNSMNIMRSEELLIQNMPEHTSFQLRLTPENASDNGNVTAECSISSEVVPEIIQWRVLTEFNNSYDISTAIESVDNVHTSHLQLLTDSRNNVVWLKCIVLYATAPTVPVIISTNFKIYSEPRIFEYKDCSVEDFKEGNGGCRLSCTSQHDDRYVFQKEKWIYFTSNESSEFMDLTGELISKPSPYRVTSTLFLDDFSSGFYQCVFELKSATDGRTVSVNHTFKIEPDQEGIRLGGACSSSGQCLALDSDCDQGKCGCKVNVSTSYGEIACLKGVPILDKCVINNQCSLTTAHAVCEENECHCPDMSVVMFGPAPMCLQNVTYGEKCLHSVQCHTYTHCLNSSCFCIEGYSYDKIALVCVVSANMSVENEKVSTGSVVGILLLVGIVLAVAAAVVSTSLKKYRKKQRRLKVKQAENINLQEAGPGAIGQYQERGRNNDDSYWYNPHQPLKIQPSNVSKSSR